MTPRYEYVATVVRSNTTDLRGGGVRRVGGVVLLVGVFVSFGFRQFQISEAFLIIRSAGQTRSQNVVTEQKNRTVGPPSPRRFRSDVGTGPGTLRFPLAAARRAPAPVDRLHVFRPFRPVAARQFHLVTTTR